MKITPQVLFNNLLADELKLSRARIPTACCLSTLGTDDFPNARFVSLKEVLDDKFIVTGPLTSRKALEIKRSNKVALTFWWPESERQVRIQGLASQIETDLADKYFASRTKDSQIVSSVSQQGEEMKDLDKLLSDYETFAKQFDGKQITRPDNWGGYSIEPVRIEFMEFKQTRFHDRKLFEMKAGRWTIKKIQP